MICSAQIIISRVILEQKVLWILLEILKKNELFSHVIYETLTKEGVELKNQTKKKLILSPVFNSIKRKR